MARLRLLLLLLLLLLPCLFWHRLQSFTARRRKFPAAFPLPFLRKKNNNDEIKKIKDNLSPLSGRARPVSHFRTIVQPLNSTLIHRNLFWLVTVCLQRTWRQTGCRQGNTVTEGNKMDQLLPMVTIATAYQPTVKQPSEWWCTSLSSSQSHQVIIVQSFIILPPFPLPPLSSHTNTLIQLVKWQICGMALEEFTGVSMISGPVDF